MLWTESRWSECHSLFVSSTITAHEFLRWKSVSDGASMVESFNSIAVVNHIAHGFPGDRCILPRLKFAYGTSLSKWSGNYIETLWSMTVAQ